jgi:hypothetical protein
MPSAKEEVGRAKALLGWGDNDARYSQWRGGVKAWARTNGVTGKRQAGTAQWRTFIGIARGETGFPASGTRLLNNGSAAIKKEAEKALDKLLQDLLKKSRDTNRSHALAQLTSLASDTPNIEFAAADADADTSGRNDVEQGAFRKSVRIFLIDPGREDQVRVAAGGAYLWDGCPSDCVAIMKVASLLEVVDKVRDKIPAGRTVRAIFGALENPTPPSRIPDATRLRSDEEVEAFFDLTSAKPIRLQVVLRRDPEADPQKEDSPPPGDGEYFAADFLDAAEEYNDPGEDSDALCRNLAGYAKRTMPRKDEAFEDRKMAARRRLRKIREEGLEPVKVKHREKFPDLNIYDSDDDEWQYIEELDPQPVTGRDMIRARVAAGAAVDAYDEYMADAEENNGATRMRAREAGHEAAAEAWEAREARE